jgi:uncharacterized protein (TIGR02680 family)
VTRDLPVPGLARWQPLRAGLVDLFYYDTEEFWFRDGRLLLRGNNGTGKSKVLALLLPFLLDGDLSPHRVEPDADSKKKMEWNLLLGGAHPFPERLGYTWLEFGRIDDDGTPRFLTIGCGLKAVAGKGISRHWYFVTTGRMGEDLALVDATGTALSRERLIDALGESGTVYDRARDYRRAVDENLFGFGEQRYGALVDLLVQLRQPQLSKKPSEKALSAALTEALPPLDQAVIADVAEAFRSLEEDRDALEAMAEAHESATSFLTHYRHYARIAARRKAALPREAEGVYRRVREALSAAEADYVKADEELAAAKEKQRELDTERKRLRARDEALRAGPEMRSARELERLAGDAQRLDGEAQRLVRERSTASQRVETQRKRLADAGERLSVARENLETARQSAVDLAATALVPGDHAERVDSLLDGEPELPPIRRAAEQLVERQQRAIRHVRTLIEQVQEAGRALARAREKVTEAEADADDLAERRAGAEQVVAERGAELVSAVREHLDTATELRLADPAATLAELELWVETQDGANPAAAAVAAAGQELAGELARSDAELGAREQAAQALAGELREEIARLERGEDTAPPVPHTRDVESRSERPGAPLWQLVEFADDVEPTHRAGIEAALEAAGVLDAWVTPEADLLSADTDDVVLRPGARPATALDAVLRPAVDRANPLANAVRDDVVAQVLATIGLGEHGQTWVERDGRFRIGVLDGSWHKPVATYIGRGAREAARRARLAELRTELSTVEADLDRIAGKRGQIAERRTRLAEEITGLPGDTDLGKAHARVTALASEHERLAAKQARAAEAVVAASSRHEGASTALNEGAGDAGLPVELAELSRVDSALGDYRNALTGLWPAVHGAREAAREEREAAEDVGEAEAVFTDTTERAERAASDAEASAERYRTLHATAGAAVAELQRQLGEVADSLRNNETNTEHAVRRADKASNDRGRAEGHRETLADQLEAATEDRAAAAESFRRFASTGLLVVALPELDVPDPGTLWAPDPTVRLARRVDGELPDVAAPDDDQAWDRAQHRLNNELKTLQDTMSRRGNKASADLRDEGVVVEVQFRGRPATVPELAEALAAEVADRERLLSEREREVLENHLVNEVASTLQELISAAEAQVARMNGELAERPTSTGMRLRLLWRAREDGPAGLAAARERLLRQAADAWSAEDRSAVGGFLQAQIAEVRARNPAGTWLEHLTEALDYRTWNHFVIERHQNGQWRSATGPASGGERVLAASVPLFAAASSHYASAGSPHAPRLVTLDEAFAGVDDNARAKYLGLLTAFDLDVVMTSEREWGCYPEVPGLAISHLGRTEDVAAVLVTNWEWDGVRRRKVQSEPDTGGEEGLWTASV